ncbi:hypothetical protein SNEBB_010065 [Seison nebaliae]|nr:hypothetical protein SNEBB_010065 [Seison nebaliae]
MGYAYLVGQEILLFCSVNADQPLAAVAQLSATVQNLTMHISVSMEIKKQLVTFEHSTLLSLSSQVSNELDLLYKQIINFSYLVDRSKHVTLRKRRGLFDAVGDISHTLFGTATDKQTTYLQQQLKALTSLVEEERQQINVHSHLLNISLTSLHDINEFRTDVHNQIQSIIDTVDDFVKADEIVTTYSNSLNKMLHMIRQTQTSLVSWRTSIFHALKGTWDANLPDPAFVFSKLSEFHESNVLLPFELTSYELYNWLAVIKTSVVFQKDSLFIVLRIPTILSDDRYRLRRVLGFPTTTEVRGICLRGLPSYSHFASGKNSSAVFHDINECTKSPDNYYCKPSKLCSSTSHCACINMPIHMSTSLNECAPHLSHNCPDIVQPVKHGLAYFVQNKTTAAVHCKKQPSTLIEIQNSGLLYMHGSCQITTSLGTYYVSSPLKRNDTFLLKLSFINISKTFNFSVPDQTHLKHILDTHESIPLTSLQKQLHIIKALKHDKVMSLSHNIVLYVIVVLVILALTYAASVFIRARFTNLKPSVESTFETVSLNNLATSNPTSIYPILEK